MNRLRTLFIVVFALLLVTGGFALAQTATGTVDGTVRDASGAVIPGVEVTITNKGTAATRTSVTGDNGRFRITNVPSGQYRAEAQLTGFQTAVTEFEMDVAGLVQLALTLQVGEVTTVMEVTDVAQKVNTEEGTLSSVVQERQVQELPLNGRNVFDLAVLQPGITEDRTGGIGGFNASGNRSRGNNFSLDGVGNNDPITGGAVQVTPNLDTVAEFRIQNNNFSAEYGRNTGSVVNVVTKSGSNEFHGTAYWYHRNDALDAREFFDSDKAPLRQHQAGFTVGGPVIKNKTFFFFGFEGFHTFTGESSLNRVETPEFRNLVHSMYPGSTPDLLLQRFPGPTPTMDLTDHGSPSGNHLDPGAPDGIPDNGLVSAFAADLTKSYQYNVRIDHELTDNNKIFGRYIWEDQESPPADIRGNDNGSFFEGFFAQGVISDTHIFSPTLVNEFRFGYSRSSTDFVTATPELAYFVTASLNGGDSMASFGAYAGLPQFFTGEEYHLVDVVSINKGDHGIKVGFEYRWNQDDSDFQFLTNGYVYYAGQFDFAANLPYYVGMRVDPRQVGGKPGLVGTPHNFRQGEWGFFLQDDWKVNDRLTLNLGIRYDNYGLISDTQGRLANIILGPGTNVFERVMNSTVGAVDPSGIFAKDNNNWSPRLGFAWDMFGDGKTSLRGGFGVAYDRLFLNVSGNVRFNPPFSANLGLLTTSLAGPLGTTPQGVAQLLASGAQIPFNVPDFISSNGFNPGGGPSIRYSLGQNEVISAGRITLRSPDPSLRSSYSMNWFLGIQRELFWDMLMEVNYTASAGRKLGFIEQYNRFNGDRFGLANPHADACAIERCGDYAGSRSINYLSPYFSSENLRSNNVNSMYHGGNVSVQKRFSEGLSFQSAYTFGKALDYNSDNFGSNSGSIFSPNPGQLFLERGLSGFDVTHRWVSNFIWEIPFMKEQQGFAGQILGGWQVQGIITFQSGSPYTVQAFSSAHDYNGDGRSNDRLDAPAGGTDAYNNISKYQYISGVFGSTSSASRAVFNPNGLPGDCDGNGTPGGPTGMAEFNGRSCIGAGTLGRSNFRGPGYNNVDFSLFKNFRMPWFGQEDAKLQFRAEFFNFFNRINLNQANRSFTSGSLGRSTSTQDSREIQFALKFIF